MFLLSLFVTFIKKSLKSNPWKAKYEGNWKNTRESYRKENVAQFFCTERWLLPV